MKTFLIATSIDFTPFSIIYHVDCEVQFTDSKPVYCPEDIFEKDLILKSNLISSGNMTVVYTPNNVFPSFYEDLMDNDKKSLEEFKNELRNIYQIGDIVAYTLS